MNSISGKIVLKESGLGIPDLLVVVYDVDPGTRPEEIIGGAPDIAADRLGAVITDQTGGFELTYEDDAFRIRNPDERRPDLFLMVFAPEEAGTDLISRLLFTSLMVRQNAGRTEQYLIQLTAEQLEKAGIPLPTTPVDEVEEPKRVVERLIKADLRLETIDDGFRFMDKQRVERIHQTALHFEANLKPKLRTMLSRIPTIPVDPESFVTPDESVVEKGKAIIRRGIERIINRDDPRVRAPVTSFIALSDAQKQAVEAALEAALDEDGAIEADALHAIVGDDEGRTPATTFLVREDPILQFCRELSLDEAHCAAMLGISRQKGAIDADRGDAPAELHDAEGDLAGTGVEPITEQGINRLIARLMETITSPEERVLSGLEPRADRARVEADIQALSFPPSPADTPAFYDFHNLQIAFQHVWQEVIDEGILDLAADAYGDIVELGGNPDRPGDGLGGNPVQILQQEGRVVLTSRRVVRDHRGGTIVRDHRGEVTVRDYRGQAVVRDHRGQTVRVRARPSPTRPGSVAVPKHPADRLPDTLAELERRLKEEYAFTIYAANRKERSVNFGILVTYRQQWEPLAYQAGKLVKTITLAPKETQKYSKKTVVRRKRAEKEVESHLRTRQEEAAQTSRAEREIIRKATTKTNFSLTAKDSLHIPLAEGVSIGSERTAGFEREASKSSEDVKKAFHEAVFKSAQEYKDEHTVEVNTEEAEEFEVEESGEITNPNDEIAVTFLFYELQRRYRLTERIQRLTPVILVAQEVPRPDEIDEAWLIAHDWILSRALLDDSFRPALNYLSQSVVGDEVALEERRRNVDQQRTVVNDLQQELAAVRDRVSTQRALLERALFQQTGVLPKKGSSDLPIIGHIPVVGDVAEAAVGAVAGGLAEAAGKLGEALFGGEGAAAGQNRQEALKDAMERSAEEARDLLFRLEREVTALNAASEAYAKALSEHLNRETQIARLRTHVKQNILYYMQAIWSHEPPDQRFFRLHNVSVPILEATTKKYIFRNLAPALSSLAVVPHRRIELHGRIPVNLYPIEVKTEVKPDFPVTTLSQIADLDNLLGFKGNYMIFPLKASNALTDYMMAPYVVAGFNELVDPDDLGSWTLEEFARYVCCLKEQLSDEQFESVRAQLIQQYQRLLSNPRRSADVITVPTNSLFIEALPARHSLIEEFKARHRAIDVKKVQADVRKAELENIRLAARLLAGERDDPDIEKKIIVEGGPVPSGEL